MTLRLLENLSPFSPTALRSGGVHQVTHACWLHYRMVQGQGIWERQSRSLQDKRLAVLCLFSMKIPCPRTHAPASTHMHANTHARTHAHTQASKHARKHTCRRQPPPPPPPLYPHTPTRPHTHARARTRAHARVARAHTHKLDQLIMFVPRSCAAHTWCAPRIGEQARSACPV